MKQMRSMTVLTATFALAACGGGSKKPATTIANGGGGDAVEQRAAAPGFRDGALWVCQISDYDPQPCKLTRKGDGWHLDKLLGSQRFSGRLDERGMSLAFDGEFFCPWGECTQPMTADFQPDGNDGYVTQFDQDAIRLRYDAALESEYGGAGYGALTGREQ